MGGGGGSGPDFSQYFVVLDESRLNFAMRNKQTCIFLRFFLFKVKLAYNLKLYC
jgi:hypothetical protein